MLRHGFSQAPSFTSRRQHQLSVPWLSGWVTLNSIHVGRKSATKLAMTGSTIAAIEILLVLDACWSA